MRCFVIIQSQFQTTLLEYDNQLMFGLMLCEQLTSASPHVQWVQKDVTIIGYMAVISTLCSGFICAVKRSEHFVKPADTLQWLVLLLGIGV
jgi:hypothetical protein